MSSGGQKLNMISGNIKNDTGRRMVKKEINSLRKRIKEHQEKIRNPQNVYDKWDTFNEKRKRDELEHWETEIRGWEKEIKRDEEKIDEYDRNKAKRGTLGRGGRYRNPDRANIRRSARLQ